MARKTPSRLQLRKDVEAAASKKTATGDGGAKKKKTTKKKKATRRAKVKAPERKRLIWAVFNASMKEEARFPYEERDAAEEKLQKLRAKGKKAYFIQPIKEVITEPLPEPEEES